MEEALDKFPAKLDIVRRGKGKVQRIVTAPRSSIAQALLVHRRKPLRLFQHQFMLPIYDIEYKQMLLKCGRQVAKSTTLCNIMLTCAIAHEAFRILYVSPSSMQSRQFSNEKLAPTIKDSRVIADHFFSNQCIDQVMEKTLTNGSHMFLRYAFLTADRARGIPSDLLMIDEIQDILKDNVKVIAECLSFSDYAYELYSGTPKTFENTIEEYWQWSKQLEWMVPCDCGKGHAKHYWNQLGLDNIGKDYLICKKCGKQLYPIRGQWVITNPEGEYMGFHVTQLMVPWKQGDHKWRKEIVWKMENWPAATFHNEVLGESYDHASKPMTKAALQQCCHPAHIKKNIDTEHFISNPHDANIMGREIFAGIDYGEGREEGGMVEGKKRHASFTVLTLGTFLEKDMFWPFFMKRYRGKEIDPEFVKRDVCQLCGKFNVKVLGADHGHGWGMNSYFINQMGRERVMEFEHNANLKQRIKWDKLGFKFILNRSMAIADLFEAIKTQHCYFPNWEEFLTFARDFLGVYVDYNERLKKMYFDHPVDQPDDAMHSMLYCRLAGKIIYSEY